MAAATTKESEISEDTDRQTRPEWETEGDRKAFTCAACLCMILRDKDTGTLSGFVVLEVTHPLARLEGIENCVFGKCEKWCAHAAAHYFSVHGGITHLGRTRDLANKELHVIGFTTDHQSDFKPRPSDANPNAAGAEYRNMAYVDSELRKLAGQVKEKDWIKFFKENNL